MQKNAIIVGVIALIIGLAGGYFGGKTLTPKRAINANRGINAPGGQFRQPTNGQRSAFGQIQEIESDKLILKTREGSSQIILLTADTAYEKSVGAAREDFQPGSSIVVNGKTNPDGSVTATSVQTAPTNSRVFGN